MLIRTSRFIQSSKVRCYSTQLPRVGWIGVGVMGKSMASHLVKAGYPLTVYTRTTEKMQPLLELGAIAAESPRKVAENSDIVFSIVGYPQDVEQVILHKQTGALGGLKKGGILVDMTTSKPSLAKRIADEAKLLGCHSVDAPVSGGDIGARNATLSIMVGAEQEPFQSVKPILEKLGKNIQHMGGPGAGQNTKMVNQILISTTMIGLVEALLYAHKSGLDLSQAIKAVETGAAGSWSLSNYGPRIVKGDLNPGFFVEHFIKDMDIVLEEAKEMNLQLPGLELARKLYVELKNMGHGKKGTHALILAVAKMNNIELHNLNLSY
eukprot:TRINITY_DN5386_c0_g1_i1.p1 TRINITY_DN5386_c0_g1~~TRINITY_DN5386_c0_g1_i1.p1  ORF type:complete len:322 (+),score=48.97 TRINITY_DN5386_c0_g1_i1:30-995(+)